MTRLCELAPIVDDRLSERWLDCTGVDPPLRREREAGLALLRRALADRQAIAADQYFGPLPLHGL